MEGIPTAYLVWYPMGGMVDEGGDPVIVALIHTIIQFPPTQW